jgi:hypothetical protein
VNPAIVARRLLALVRQTVAARNESRAFIERGRPAPSTPGVHVAIPTGTIVTCDDRERIGIHTDFLID